MKKFGLVFVTIILVYIANAQQTTRSSVGNAASVGTTSAGNGASVRSGKVVTPREKAQPVSIPKTSAELVIDGRADEDIWKRAAVFKDFYQTSPGYNTAAFKTDRSLHDV